MKSFFAERRTSMENHMIDLDDLMVTGDAAMDYSVFLWPLYRQEKERPIWKERIIREAGGRIRSSGWSFILGQSFLMMSLTFLPITSKRKACRRSRKRPGNEPGTSIFGRTPNM